MNLNFIDTFINRKISENEEYIVYSFYEVRVKENLTEEETCKLLELSKIRFENIGYNVYFTNDEYIYKGEIKKVQSNELLIAIKKQN